MEQEKLKEMEQLFNTLTEENQSILIMVANGMNLAQNTQNSGFNSINSNELKGVKNYN